MQSLASNIIFFCSSHRYFTKLSFIFQFQANELIRLLRTKIDYNLDSTGGGGDDPNLSDTPVATFTKLGGKGGKRSRGGGKSATSHQTSSAKKQRLFKTEVGDDDDDDDDGGDTGILDDPDFMPAKKRASNPAIPSLSARTTSSVKKETDKPFATKSTAATYQRDPNKRQVLHQGLFF